MGERPCRCCGGSGREPQITVEEIAAWLRQRRHVVTRDGYTDTRGAAAYLSLAEQTLRATRGRIAYVRRGGRCWYALAVLATC